ncbi:MULTISPECIES: hypothetical protein [unclassified Brevibacterium]|uniref:SA1002 family membrane protein n=1 Tax=unclassified Brevibacterium TaxID=2614124 RepID=UPI0015E7E7F7|nr:MULTISPECIES: hypothetical protein [unclassified Brevibacterium]MCM1013656.1 hypothetical protein [Brevibacterium sp. XM4083]
MSLLVHLVVLCGLFIIMGILTTPPGNRDWKRIGGFLGAIGLGLAMTVVGMVVLIVMLGLYIVGVALINIGPGLFLGVISVALASGIIMFLIVQPIFKRAGVGLEILTITEYYIQWFLIYVTVYQVIFDQLNGLGRVVNERDLTQELNSYLSSILDPSALIAILLPVLLSIWVAVAIAKIRLDAPFSTDGDSATAAVSESSEKSASSGAEADDPTEEPGESRVVQVERLTVTEDPSGTEVGESTAVTERTEEPGSAEQAPRAAEPTPETQSPADPERTDGTGRHRPKH